MIYALGTVALIGFAVFTFFWGIAKVEEAIAIFFANIGG